MFLSIVDEYQIILLIIFQMLTELTINFHFETPVDSFPDFLNRVIPLKNLTTLNIKSYSLSLEPIINLICFTPNLQTLKFNFLCIVKINTKSIEQSRIFQYVSNTNKIKYLDFHSECSLERVQLIVKLFPKLEYMKIEMKKKETNEIVRFILTNNKTQKGHLFFLCMSQAPKRCLKQLNMLINLENLLDNFYMKFVNHDLYLWW